MGLIIGELCQNHLGDMDLLTSMVDTLADIGARFAKIQSFFAADLRDQTNYQEVERMRRLELSWPAQAQFMKQCEDRHIVPMTSVYSARYIPNLKECGFHWIKFGSAQCTNERLIQAYWDAGFSCVVSTGGHALTELPSYSFVSERAAQTFVLLHCVSLYPVAWSAANVYRIAALRGRYPRFKIGFSDHTSPLQRWDVPVKCAMSLFEPFMVEKHFTMLSRDLTKDGPVSIDSDQMIELVRFNALSLDKKHEEMEKSGFGMLCGRTPLGEASLIQHYKDRWLPDAL